MTPEGFRRLVLAFPAVTEWPHPDRCDFRVSGRVLASLGWPDEGWGMVCVAPSQRAVVTRSRPDIFHCPTGARLKPGSTLVRLEALGEVVLLAVLRQAWARNAGLKIRQRHAASVAAVG